MTTRAVPILTSVDLAATLAFYERLGFENRGAPPEDWDHLIVSRDGLELHVAGPSGGRRPAGSCHLFVDDADELHREWCVRAPAARLEPPADTAYGRREFPLFDLHGNELRVGGPVRAAAVPQGGGSGAA